jgi:hypothetical protein
MFRHLQNTPHLLELTYQVAYKAMLPFRRWLLPGSRAERVFIWLEKLSKGAIFDCRMCGQCVLHQHRHDLPDDLPEKPAQRAVRGRAAQWELRDLS